MEPDRRDPQQRTQADARTARKHAPHAQTDGKEPKERAPGIEEHDAAGQGLSG